MNNERFFTMSLTKFNATLIICGNWLKLEFKAVLLPKKDLNPNYPIFFQILVEQKQCNMFVSAQAYLQQETFTKC